MNPTPAGGERGLASRMLDLPSTRVGGASIVLGMVFGAGVAAFQILMRTGRIHGPSLFGDPVAACVLIAAALAALAGGIAALFAVIVRGERSLLVIVMIGIAVFVAVFVSHQLTAPPR